MTSSEKILVVKTATGHTLIRSSQSRYGEYLMFRQSTEDNEPVLRLFMFTKTAENLNNTNSGDKPAESKVQLLKQRKALIRRPADVPKGEIAPQQSCPRRNLSLHNHHSKKYV